MSGSKEFLRVALVGCGRISTLHHQAYEAVDGADVFLVCDSDSALAERRASEWKVPRFTASFDEVLTDPDIDAVEVLTPQKLHEGMVLRALEAGKHVAVQKPMAINLASADRMMRAAERSGRILKVTENYVTYPPIVEARRLLDAGAIGDPINIRINLLAFGRGGWDIPDSAWEWRMQELLEDRGQEAFDHGHHLWSAAWHLMGGFTEVTARIDSFQDMIDAPAVMMWKHAGDRRYGTCSISYCNEASIESDYYSNDEWIDITGSRGIIRINRCTGKLVDGPVLSLYRDGAWEHRNDIPSDWRLGFAGAAENFIRSVRGESEPYPSAAQGREILAMNLAIQASSRERRTAYIAELDRPWPAFYAWRENRRIARRESRRKTELLKDFRRSGKGPDPGERARELTFGLPSRANPEVMRDWTGLIGVVLRCPDQTEERYGITVRDGACSVGDGFDEADADLVVRTPRAVWGAVLLGKKKVQTAYIQGKFKLDGDYEFAFKLVSLFGF